MENDYERYRREMEESVSNQSGSSAGDVLFTILPNICSILLAITILTLAGSHVNQQSKLLIEFCTLIIPCVLCCTVLSEKVIAICQIFLIVATGNILSILVWKSRDTLKLMPNPNPNPNRIHIITYFRAMVNIITVVCILAVDFQCFPRKFVKTETYGFSLMDTGVGLFVVANALVAPEVRNVDQNSKLPFFHNLAQTIKGITPLLILGSIRSLCVELLGYQLHVTEYGKHWNFYFTLACVKLFTEILSYNLRSKYSVLTGLWILAMHEYGLSTQGLKDWVLSDVSRNDWISANREGLISIPGYVGLYLLGVALGRLIHTTFQNVDNQLVFNVKISTYEFHIGYTRTMSLTLKFYVISNLTFFITYYCEQYFQISRRLANSGYCAWILTLSTLFITCLLLIDVILECISGCMREKNRRKIAKHLLLDDLSAKENIIVVKNLEICDAVNDNGLLFFLFANLLTFAINMSIKTLRVDESRAVAIIIVYMVVNVTFVLLRYRAKNLLSVRKNK